LKLDQCIRSDSLKKIFQRVDVNGDGFIDHEELENALKEDHADNIFEKMDYNAHGSINLEDLKSFLRDNPHAKSEFKQGVLTGLRSGGGITNWEGALKTMMRREKVFEDNPRPYMTYETFLYILFLLVTVLAVLERFYINWTPDFLSHFCMITDSCRICPMDFIGASKRSILFSEFLLESCYAAAACFSLL